MRRAVLLLLLLLPGMAAADSDIVEIHYLPLAEAEAAARTQLSAGGSIAAMPSRNILIVNDDAAHIRSVRALLKRLDIMPQQYSVRLEIVRLDEKTAQGIKAEAVLPNGWVEIHLSDSHSVEARRQRFDLHLTANRRGTIEVGTLHPYRQHLRQWLAGYGVVDASSVETLSVTSGFSAVATTAGAKSVTLRIEPWMRNLRGGGAVRGESEILIDLGSTRSPKHPPQADSPMRMNASPETKQDGVIDIAGAATEVTLPLGRDVTIMASSEEAQLLGEALLSGHSSVNGNRLAISVRVEPR